MNGITRRIVVALAAALLLAPLAALHAVDTPTPAKDGPVVLVTILRVDRHKSIGLDAQLAALQPAKGKLLVSTNVDAASAADFEVRFSWRSSKDAVTDASWNA